MKENDLDCVCNPVMMRLADCIRELYEQGMEAAEICERAAQLIDVVGGEILRQARERRREEERSAKIEREKAERLKRELLRTPAEKFELWRQRNHITAKYRKKG